MKLAPCRRRRGGYSLTMSGKENQTNLREKTQDELSQEELSREELSREIGEVASLLHKAERVVVFSGAGVSKESGIDTFRDEGGLWEKFPPERFATASGLSKTALKEPKALAGFLREVLLPLALAAPNEAHNAIAELEKHCRVDVVTQNVDHLHQEAGSTRVHEIHGSLFQVVNGAGRVLRALKREDLVQMADALKRLEKSRLFTLLRMIKTIRPLLGISGKGASANAIVHRPSIVLFGEDMREPDWDRAQKAAARAELMIMVGTSQSVWPAASLPDHTWEGGGKVIGVGPEEGEADHWLLGRAAAVLPKLVREATVKTNEAT
ncbi:MAG: iron dicitrate transport regulator FecR [Deltaproteobacteria bacterium]|nr:iron dicitrate transport regulator FecR [Deltaproteobacteria bacterium]